ncbi:aldehyde ferredoxin oxidoreductase N-terminal domain-containing protein [Maridesulfovibrio frigidus]|uniref:aldehyde ferredoxin oxidoreductase N-terminal domain-containing protein n=1 Tax=Maridesulfovibrio frigidus TaxID=340956 RepID=UPI0004E0B2A4|nr:aldehyde ferredoxin oxidoreductase C-terminal domain-containing protein [Maridesulfovibrio frigidus]
MIRDYFRVLVVDLATGKGNVAKVEGRNEYAGGSGLGALLFSIYGHPTRPWDDPDQPLIFSIGALTGLFPLMSKTVCSFKSPYHDQFAESHAGGRSALAIRFADYDAIVIKGRAPRLSCLSIGMRHLEVKDVQFLAGKDVFATGKMLRRMFPGSGHRSILRIGPAGENLSGMACINADTYRHFGRLGSGGVMGSKNLKGIVILGDGSFVMPEGNEYSKVFDEVYDKMTGTDMMSKYHNLGTAANLNALNELKSLPWRNLQATSDDDIAGITGEKFADETLLRNAACAGCPVGCIHLGFVREKFMEQNQYMYRQVAYDYEPIFATGSMLGVTDPFHVLTIMDEIEKAGLDVMSGGVALAWATEAFEKGLITEKETIVPLAFGDAEGYQKAVYYMGEAENDFYAALIKGSLVAAKKYGGEDFACVLGQEMAGYATGETFYVAEALGFRHSHLDSGGYSWDQKNDSKDVNAICDFLIGDETGRAFITSMVACLFGRGVYNDEQLASCLHSVGYSEIADNMDTIGERVRALRWKMRFDTGYDPDAITIPKRYNEVTTWKGKTDPIFLAELKKEYGNRIRGLVSEEALIRLGLEKNDKK